MKDKGLIYARLSREDEDKIDKKKSESRSIENQIKLLSDYAREKGIEIYKIIYDDGVSGGTFDRPGFNEVINEMKAGNFNILLIKDFSRLGRKMHRVGDYIENIFPAYNIRVISVDDKYDSATFNSEEPILIKNFVNDYNLRDFKKKMRKVRRHCAMTKHLNYYPKFGYNFDSERKEIIDDYSAGIVRRAYDLVGNHCMSTLAVSKIFNEEGVPTRSYYATAVLGLKALHKTPSKEWNAEKVWEIVRDYEYCGHSVNWTRHNKEEQIILKNTHLAIIDEDLYWRTQQIIDKHSRLKERIDHLGRLLIDRKTGKHLFYRRTKLSEEYTSYFLRVDNRTQYSIRAADIENAIYNDVLQTVQLCRLDSERFYRIFKDKLFGNSGCDEKQLKDELKKANERYGKLLEDYFEGKILESVFQKTSKKLTSEIQEMERRISSASDYAARISLFQLKFKKFIASLESEPRNKYELIRTAVSRVYINKVLDIKKFDITIVYKFEEIN